MFHTFVHLMENGTPDEFHAHAAKYEEHLKTLPSRSAYYKIKTNEGFFDASHQLTIRAILIAQQLEDEMSASGDTAYHYLVSGLRGDIYKSMNNAMADSLYQVALQEVGDKDPKFTMLTHVNLSQVNYLSNPKKSLEWAKRALDEAERLNSFEHRSMSLGIMAFVYFMTGEKDEFMATVQEYELLKEEYNALVEEGKVGKQMLNTRYDTVIEVGKLGFQGMFDEAIELAKSSYLNVDRQMVIYCLRGMEGGYEKDLSIRKLTRWLIILTTLYIFVYIMGRRRLMKKIWKRNAELKVALYKADAANQMKANFIRSMSHEIRTPLNAINGFSQIICDPDAELNAEEKQDICERITSSSEAITIIINELLELAAGESVTLDLSELTPIRINDLCRKAVSEAQQHNDHGLEISLTTELSDDFSIKSNEETILQILEKIFSNALKFTSEGSIAIHASREKDSLRISVTDTGIGIPEDKYEDVFNNFVKLDDFTDGIGLGLSIGRRLAKSLGGDITIDPSYKNGSRFIVQLPIIK